MMEPWEENTFPCFVGRNVSLLRFVGKGQMVDLGTNWQQQMAGATQPNSSCKHLASFRLI